MPLQIRRGTQAERLAMSQPLAQGELLYVTDDKRLYIGDNATLGGVQITGYTNEDAVDAAGAALVAGTHSGITFTYGVTQDTANRIDATVSISQLSQNLNLNGFNITGSGNISISGTIAGDLNGSIFADNSTLLIDGTNGRINLDGTISGNVIPTANEVYDIGSSSFRFRDLYLSGSSIELGAATITATGSAVNLPEGSTVGGVPIGQTIGDLKGSVFGDDSSILVDAIDSSLHTVNLTLIDNTIESDLGFVNIGSGISKTEIHLYQDDAGAFLRMYGENDAGTGDSSWANFYNSRGTIATPTANIASDLLSGFLIFGHDGGSYSRSVTIAGRVASGGTIATGKIPGELLVLVQSDTIGVSQQLSFDYQGILSVPVTKTTVYSVAGTALPSAVTAGAGARAFVSDATANTFGTAYAGSGGFSVPVYSDGSAWYIG